MQHYNHFITRLKEGSASSFSISGARGSVIAFLAAQATVTTNRPLLCVLPSESQALNLAQDLELFSSHPVLHYPGHEIPAYTPLSPDPQITASRLATLYHARNATTPFIITASCEALLRKVMPLDILSDLAELVMAGEECDQTALTAQLTLAGYEKMNLVQSPGEFSVRGDILDIFAPGFEAPLRLDFFGDLIESIRLFDPISQKSIREIEEAEIIPVSDILFPAPNSPEKQRLYERILATSQRLEWDYDEQEVLLEKITTGQKFAGIEFFLPLFYESLATPLSFLAANTVIFKVDPYEINKSAELVWERINSNYSEAMSAQTALIPPEELFISTEALNSHLEERQVVHLYDFEEISMHPIEVLDMEAPVAQHTTDEKAAPPAHREHIALNCGNHKLIKQHIELQRQKMGLLLPLTTYLRSWIEEGEQIAIACRSHRHATHLGTMLAHHGIETTIAATYTATPPSNIPVLYTTPLSSGFDFLEQKLHILSELELFGEKRLVKGKKSGRIHEGEPVAYEELKIGDMVVHADHGLGIYDGIINMNLGAVSNDFLLLTYKDNDKLYVPVDRINSISKYNGLSDKVPQISQLGSKKWQSAKEKVKKEVWKVAQSLLNLYARRKLIQGTQFSQPDALFQELEESFPYDETPGQNKAITDVINNLTSEQCMDRLVCGDVGFGKTEVAVRAAFKVVVDNYQVAILVPTTVLAEQHAQTFRERFEGFPVSVECLNRFRTSAEQKKIIHDLNEGRIDIIIGTHRLLSKDVVFKKLGLLIIDEEHRFGVTHKEKLKLLRTGVDVLTLTATPIPRTLQMSLLGVRDLSVISSPPKNRRSIKTFVAKYDDLVIKEAVIREMQRGGQIFLVHNRVRSIQELAFRVQKLVPEARIAVAHGQMPGKILEEIMVSFIRHDIDVLICTTIIESGLDIPNANTIIINRADRMGLAEIYQLRGRVGRSNEQAYAYLLVPSLELMSKDAKQRLRALMEYNELGGGFKLALSDLQIRGGGNILGESQSGNIAAVGYDLYLDLLQKTVEDLKRRDSMTEGQHEPDAIEPEINLTISAYIPETYIYDPDQRYIAYRRISGVSSSEELTALQEEFRDRYGVIPDETHNLFGVVSLKEELKKLRVAKLEQSKTALVFTFANNKPVSSEKILLYLEKSKKNARLTPDSRLIVTLPAGSTESIFDSVKNVLRSIG